MPRHAASVVILAVAALAVTVLSGCRADTVTAPADDKTCYEVNGQIYCK